MYFQKICLNQGRTQSIVNNTYQYHRNNSIDKGRNRTHFCQSIRQLLGLPQNVLFVKISDDRICNHVESKTCNGSDQAPLEYIFFISTLIDVQETRLLNGWSYDKKRGSTRNDGFPVGIYDEIRINTRKDYEILLPDTLPETFTVKDYKQAAHVSESLASTGLNILFYLELVERIGKQGNAYLYKRLDNT